MSEEDVQAFLLAQAWFYAGEFSASLIVFEALWKKHPHDFKILMSFIYAQEKNNPLKALDFCSEILAGEGAWLRFLQNVSDSDRAILLEVHGMLAYKLKDEVSAL